MPHADFVHLRLHSAYSLSEGAIKIPDLAELCRANAMPAVAVTDSGNLFAALEFATTVSKAGVQPIIGCIIGLRRAAPDNQNGAHASPPPDQLVLLVQNETGYRHLLKLVSRSFLASAGHEQAQLDLADLDEFSDGLIALTGGPGGAVGRLLAEGQQSAAEAMLGRLAELFPGRLYVEIMRYGMAEETATEAALIDLAYARDLPLVATNDVHFADADIYEAHDVLICIAQGKRVDEADRRRLTPEHRFKSAAEMRTLFADLPEAVDNTLVIARRCAYMPAPREPMLPSFATHEGHSEAEELREMALAGLESRLQQQIWPDGCDPTEAERLATPYRQRLTYELDVIIDMGFAGYFMIVAEFIQWAKQQGIPVGPGRGSGAGSVVAWALTITDLDPLRFGLLFERFLNPERVSMPDFDIDFCQDRRDEVIRHVQAKYGSDRVAQIITFGKLQARAALRDVGRVLGMPYGQVDRISKLVPYNPANPVTLSQAIAGEPQLQEMRREDETVARLLDVALKLEGLYRHASTHAAGVVIGDRPLDKLIPLYRDPRSNMPVTQFSMKYVEMAGLVKFDFLGLKTLTVLAQAEALVRARGEPLDLAKLPLDDVATYELMSAGDTVGVFQLEGSGMREMLKSLRPNRFEDIIAVVALYRPGPMENIPSYINRKHGREAPDYLHPSLTGILKETYGIIIYQEQVMQIAQELSGYTLGAADLLRRAMGKKNKAEMAAQRQNFVDGALARGVERDRAVQIFDLVDKFAGYGFNKSHAAAYALVAYQTAYVKANYPVEFMAALMTLDLGNTDKLNAFRQELERLGIVLLPPSINRSGVAFAVETLDGGGRAIRYALAAVKNVGRQAMETLIREREANGDFRDLFDLANRLDTKAINKRQLENLARAGAFDSMNPNRAQVLASVDLLMRHANAAANERESRQVSLFADAGPDAVANPSLVAADPWSETERLQHEFEAVGFYLSAHPLDAYRTSLKRLGVIGASEIVARLAHGGASHVRLAGMVIGKQERTSARGSRFAFVQLSDSSGVVEITLFSEVLATSRDLVEGGRPLLVTAEARLDADTLRVTAQKVENLDQAAAGTAEGLQVFLADPQPLGRVRSIIETGDRGHGRVSLILDCDHQREVELTLPGQYAVSPTVRAAIKAVPGVVDVQEI
jgi:DNA polymerase-3 subunit alpha